MNWDLLQSAGVSLLVQFPALAVWTAVLVIGIRMARNSGTREAGYMAAGGGIKLAGIILSVIFQYTGIWLFSSNGDIEAYRFFSGNTGWIVDIISLAGYLCLFYAFWLKSKTDAPSHILTVSTSGFEPDAG